MLFGFAAGAGTIMLALIAGTDAYAQQADQKGDAVGHPPPEAVAPATEHRSDEIGRLRRLHPGPLYPGPMSERDTKAPPPPAPSLPGGHVTADLVYAPGPNRVVDEPNPHPGPLKPN